MTNKEMVLTTMKRYGEQLAEKLQANSSDMTGTELYDNEQFIPRFKEARAVQNMRYRKAGLTDGFVCKSTAGRVVRLIQNYDSDTYTGEPEELPAQWGFKWSTDPAKALPFVAISTSPYNEGECCTENDVVYRSKYDNNVHAPSAWPDGWSKVERQEAVNA